MLCLVGSGEYLPPMEPIDRFLFDQLKQEPRVICLPTAAGTEGHDRVRYWMDLGTTHYRRLGVQAQALPIIDAESANNKDFAQKIERANFIFLSGGRPDYLFKVLSNSLAWEAIMKVHQQGGVLAGCSAGAMIMGKGFPGFPRWQNAFGLLDDVVILPHFDELPSIFVNSMRRLIRNGNTVLGIEGSTALIADGQRRFVRGKGGVTVLHAKGTQRFIDGQEILPLL